MIEEGSVPVRVERWRRPGWLLALGVAGLMFVLWFVARAITAAAQSRPAVESMAAAVPSEVGAVLLLPPVAGAFALMVWSVRVLAAFVFRREPQRRMGLFLFGGTVGLVAGTGLGGPLGAPAAYAVLTSTTTLALLAGVAWSALMAGGVLLVGPLVGPRFGFGAIVPVDGAA